MSLIHEQSCDCVKSELDLFSVPMTQTSVEQGRFIEYGPISSIDNGPIEFKISGSETEYIDLMNTYVFVKVKVTTPAGANIAADDEVAPVNLLLHSLFSQVDMFLGDSLVTSSTNTYAYRAYIETLLSYGNEAKDSQLTAAMWYKDGTNMLVHAENAGYQKRKALVADSAPVEMMGKLHLDMLFQDRYLLNGVNIKLKLIPQASSFCLMSGGNPFILKIMEAKLMVRKVKLSAAVQLAHARALEESNAKYPIRRVECKSFTMSRGVRSGNEENLFSGQIPKRIVLGFVSNNGYNGSFTTNPFNFEHFNVEQINLTVDGQQMPAKPLQMNFADNEYIQSYMTLFSGTGMSFKDDGNNVSRDEYKAGFTLFAYDLTPDMEESGHVQLIKQGIVSLGLKFRDALAAAVNVIVYAEFENLIEIDKHRQVIFDYSS